MALDINFTVIIDNTLEGPRIKLTDTTVPEDNIIISKEFKIVDVYGEETKYTLNANEFIAYHDYDKDSVYLITLSIEYSVDEDNYTDQKTKNVLIAIRLPKKIYDMRYSLIKKDCSEACKLSDFIKEIELIDSFYQAALNLTSTDVLRAQKNLDTGNSLINNCDY